MRYVAYFAIPTLAGWLAGSLTCIATMSLIIRDWLSYRDLLNVIGIAGMVVVAPSFFLCILPYCGISLRLRRDSKIETRCNFYPLPLFLLLLFFGGLITFFRTALMFVGEPNLIISLPPENPILWFLPFVPYAAVVALLSQRFFKMF